MLLDPIPNTTGYMIAGYTVVFVVMALYLLSLYLRRRNFQRDLETLNEMRTEKPKSKSKK